LTKKYTWLAIIVSFLIGGGVATVVNQLTENAKKKLLKTEIVLEEADTLLKNGKRKIKDLNNLSKSINEKTMKTNEELEILNQVREKYSNNIIKSFETINQLEIKINNLTKIINSLTTEKEIRNSNNLTIENIKFKKAILSSLPETDIYSTIENIKLGNYTVYIHYSQQNKRDIISNIHDYLQKKGYITPNIRKVIYKINDIRYFYKKDYNEALKIKKEIIKYLSQKNININLKITYFGNEYPNMRKGTIEIWLFLKSTL